MLEFLKKSGIKDSVIYEIEKVNSSANLYNLNCNQDEVIKIIQSLRDIGINCVEKLLIYKIDLFFTSFDDFKCRYIKQDVDKFVKLINEDYMLIEEL